VTDSGKPRFIAFISRREEMAGCTALRPEADFVFASYSQLGPDAVHVDPRRMEEATETFRDLHKQRLFTAVLNRKEKCVVPAAVLADALGLPPIASEPERARDKFTMRRALNGCDSFPRTALVREAKDLGLVQPDMFPCVLKPRFGFNSRSAVLVGNRAELESAYREQHARYAQLPKQDGTNNDFVVEELIAGSEHNVESLVKDGKPLFHLVSDKLPMTPPFFVEIGDNMPSRLPDDAQDLCRRATDHAIRAMGIRNGWTHTEVKLDGNKSTVVECAARMGGGYFENLFQDVYGINRMAMLIDLYLGRSTTTAPIPRLHAAARRLVVYGPAQPRKLRNAHDLFADDRGRLVWPDAITKIDRELAGPPSEFNNTLCEFIAFGASGEEAAELADKLIAEADVRTLER
jgi:hypothetical protein